MKKIIALLALTFSLPALAALNASDNLSPVTSEILKALGTPGSTVNRQGTIINSEEVCVLQLFTTGEGHLNAVLYQTKSDGKYLNPTVSASFMVAKNLGNAAALKSITFGIDSVQIEAAAGMARTEKLRISTPKGSSIEVEITESNTFMYIERDTNRVACSFH